MVFLVTCQDRFFNLSLFDNLCDTISNYILQDLIKLKSLSNLNVNDPEFQLLNSVVFNFAKRENLRQSFTFKLWDLIEAIR